MFTMIVFKHGLQVLQMFKQLMLKDGLSKDVVRLHFKKDNSNVLFLKNEERSKGGNKKFVSILKKTY